jgi:hypothetical protein
MMATQLFYFIYSYCTDNEFLLKDINNNDSPTGEFQIKQLLVLLVEFNMLAMQRITSLNILDSTTTMQ